MKKSINGWAFDLSVPLADTAKRVKDAGFEAFELTIEGEGQLATTTDESAVRKIGDEIRATGLDVASLACGLFWGASFSSPDPADRDKAKQWTRAGLQAAHWLGTDALLVVPGLVSHFAEPTKMVTGYADALNLAYEGLRELAPEAEKLGVTIAVENVWNAFLLSPVEFRDLIDRVNSPRVQAYFDTGNVLKFGFPQDWINILGKRIVRVHLKDFKVAVGNIDGFCALGDGDANWPEIMKALKGTGYNGPMTYEGPGEMPDDKQLADICQRVTQCMAAG